MKKEIKLTNEEIEEEAMKWARFLYSVYEKRKLKDKGEQDGKTITREH